MVTSLNSLVISFWLASCCSAPEQMERVTPLHRIVEVKVEGVTGPLLYSVSFNIIFVLNASDYCKNSTIVTSI